MCGSAFSGSILPIMEMWANTQAAESRAAAEATELAGVTGKPRISAMARRMRLEEGNATVAWERLTQYGAAQARVCLLSHALTTVPRSQSLLCLGQQPRHIHCDDTALALIAVVGVVTVVTMHILDISATMDPGGLAL